MTILSLLLLIPSVNYLGSNAKYLAYDTILIYKFMKKYLILPIILLSIVFAQSSNAQEFDPAIDSVDGPQPMQYSETQYGLDQYIKAEVIEVIKDDYIQYGTFQQPYQEITARLLEGAEKGQILTLQYGSGATLQENQRLKKGQTIIVGRVEDANGTTYYVLDIYRLNPAIWLLALFVFMTLLLGRKRGFTSLLGLLFTILILAYILIPQIVAGRNPVMVIILGAFAIAISSLYLAHGFNRQTSIAVVSTLITLIISIGFSMFAVWFVRLSGQGSEDAAFLQFGALSNISLSGLLLAGIIIGTLGVLDDITTAQSAVVLELKKANPLFKLKDLYSRSINVGREHIASLVNTLVLAYAGASFPLLLLFVMDNHRPWWVIINGENIMEEIVRTLSGSMTLVVAVPITTFLAAWYWSKNMPTEKETQSHNHSH